MVVRQSGGSVVTVPKWSGRETRALREALRMSLRDFAVHLGISDRMVSKWEAGGANTSPRPVNQQALDTCLQRADAAAQQRFEALLHRVQSSTVQSSKQVPTPSTAVAAVSVRPAVPQVASNDKLVHPHDGKTMVLIPEGHFPSGEHGTSTWLPSYYIDAYPVSNAEYQRFVEATGHRSPQHWAGGSCPQQILDHPVVFVTHQDATAYAVWATKQLSSSHQWEKAARGPEGTVYPWGTSATPAKCNVRENGVGATTPCGRYHSGATTAGVYDLCGNTWEWTSTESSPGRFELKGGAFSSPFACCAPHLFNDASSSMLDDDTGFRCVVPRPGVG